MSAVWYEIALEEVARCHGQGCMKLIGPDQIAAKKHGTSVVLCQKCKQELNISTLSDWESKVFAALHNHADAPGRFRQLAAEDLKVSLSRIAYAMRVLKEKGIPLPSNRGTVSRINSRGEEVTLKVEYVRLLDLLMQYDLKPYRYAVKLAEQTGTPLKTIYTQIRRLEEKGFNIPPLNDRRKKHFVSNSQGVAVEVTGYQKQVLRFLQSEEMLLHYDYVSAAAKHFNITKRGLYGVVQDLWGKGIEVANAYQRRENLRQHLEEIARTKTTAEVFSVAAKYGASEAYARAAIARVVRAEECPFWRGTAKRSILEQLETPKTKADILQLFPFWHPIHVEKAIRQLIEGGWIERVDTEDGRIILRRTTEEARRTA